MLIPTAHIVSHVVVLGVTIAALALPSSEAPTHLTMVGRQTYTVPTSLTVEGLIAIAPSSGTCDGASFPDECATAATALPHILESFHKYEINHAPVQAALISLMAYESGDFKYAKNHWPGIVGQGTRNMQSPSYNLKYAEALGLGAEVTADPDTMMRTLSQDKYSFGSAAWFVSTQCPMSIRKAMWSGSEGAWETYLQSCVGTSASDERLAYWQRAMSVLK